MQPQRSSASLHEEILNKENYCQKTFSIAFAWSMSSWILALLAFTIAPVANMLLNGPEYLILMLIFVLLALMYLLGIKVYRSYVSRWLQTRNVNEYSLWASVGLMLVTMLGLKFIPLTLLILISVLVT